MTTNRRHKQDRMLDPPRIRRHRKAVAQLDGIGWLRAATELPPLHAQLRIGKSPV
jgi:hypothetical protein